MFRKFFSSFRRPPAAPVADPIIEIVPVPAAKPAAAEGADELKPVHLLKVQPTTELGKIFQPKEESSLFRHKKVSAIRVPHLLQGYGGLAADIQALSVDSQDRSGQLKALNKMARQLTRGEFKSSFGKSIVSEADRDALQALDRLLVMNKGSGEEQKLNRVDMFLKAARADHTVAAKAAIEKNIGNIEHAIDSMANKFNQGIRECLTVRRNYETPYMLEGIPPGSSVALAGVYTEVAAITTNDRKAGVQWRALDKIYQRLDAENKLDQERKSDRPLGYQQNSHIEAHHLDHEMYQLLRQCHESPLNAEQRLALVARAVEQYRPAAETAHARAEKAVVRAQEQAEREARRAAGEEVENPHSGLEALIRADEARREAAMRNPRRHKVEMYDYERAGMKPPGPFSRERLDDTSKKFLWGVLGVGPLLAAGAYGMRPQISAQSLGDSASVSAPLDINAYQLETEAKWSAEWEASLARLKSASDIRAEAASKLPSPEPYRDYRDDYRPLPIADFKPVYDSPEEEAYQQCLERTTDPVTFMPRGDEECISPDIKRIQDEAAAKYGTSKQQPGNTVEPELTPPPISEAPAPVSEEPPPISEAPRYTPAQVSFVNEAFPKLAAAAGRTAEPLTNVNVNVNFENQR